MVALFCFSHRSRVTQRGQVGVLTTTTTRILHGTPRVQCASLSCSSTYSRVDSPNFSTSMAFSSTYRLSGTRSPLMNVPFVDFRSRMYGLCTARSPGRGASAKGRKGGKHHH